MSKVLDLETMIVPDDKGVHIANQWVEWSLLRQKKMDDVAEIRDYIFATSTKTTRTGEVVPWKNSTTLPKLTQIHDNLIANYMATMIPQKKWLVWEGMTEDDAAKEKKRAIEDYTYSIVQQPRWKKELQKLVTDYVECGNCFVTTDWVDERTIQDDLPDQGGYVGPVMRRISPFDIVFNPTAPSFRETPKIVRSFVSLGEVEKELSTTSNTEEEREALETLMNYLKSYRQAAATHAGDIKDREEFYAKDGFTSFQQYLSSGTCEILTFMGDLYLPHEAKLLKNYCVKVVDRHKVIWEGPIDHPIGYPPIWHAGWRTVPDNLWAMGPLDNLVGMQHRIDHLENLKADLMDMTTFPLVTIKGVVQDFDWEPAAMVELGEDGAIELISPDNTALNVNFEIDAYQEKMEQMAGAPREAMGFRTPGEKTAYEIQRLENASARIYQHRVGQFEEDITEQVLNAMLADARVRMDPLSFRVMDSETKVVNFLEISPEELKGAGRLRPVAAQHFAEKAQVIQNLTQFANSALGQDERIRAHMSNKKLARLIEDSLDLRRWDLVEDFVAIAEDQEMMQRQMAAQEEAQMAASTPSGLTPDDTEVPFVDELSEEELAQEAELS